MNKNYPTFFLTWFNKFSRVPYPGCKIEGKMSQAMYLSIFKNRVMKIIEWQFFNLFHIKFQYDIDFKHIAKLVKQWLPMQNFDVLTQPPQ